MKILLVPLMAFVLVTAAVAQQPDARPWMPATAQKLPRWRGFNLTDKFYLHKGPSAFQEEDFRMISKLGFNFVRLPMDYRFWIKNGDWEQFDESALKDIDQAVEWGRQYGIHVCLNFHRAPGYTVAKPAESRVLWTDTNAQRVCAMHWARFARHYKGIPNERLSFDLFNEPGQVDPQVYYAVCKKMVDAIRAEDPDRLIIADGLKWGNTAVPELRPLNIAEATRGYWPMELTHFKANWVNTENVIPPIWPRPITCGFIPGPAKQKAGDGGPITIDGTFAGGEEMRLHVMNVSSQANLQVEADGQPIWHHLFQCGPGEGEWKQAVFEPKWKVYQNVYDRDYVVPIPARAHELRISVTQGDWLKLNELTIRPGESGTSEDILPLSGEVTADAPPVRYHPGAVSPFTTATMEDRAYLWRERIEPWKQLEASGVGVIVGEWGAYNKAPHDVILRWMEDCLTNWKEADWGWALWNFRGSFGVLDSERADVQYEDYDGHKLDRKMLDLLQRY